MSKYMPRHPKPSFADMAATFLENHVGCLASTRNFFVVPTATFSPSTLPVLVVLAARASAGPVHIGTTAHPTADVKVAQQIREAFPLGDSFHGI